MNWPKKTLLIVSSVVLTAIVLLFLFVRLYLTDERLRDIAEPLLEEQLGRDVSIGGFQVRVLRSLPDITVGVTDVIIHSPSIDGEPSPDLASVGKLWVELPILPTLQGNIEIKALELDDPTILVEVYDDLSSNLIELGEAETDTLAAESPDVSETTEISLERVIVRNGQIGYVHADGTLLALDGVNTELSARLADISVLEGQLSIDDAYYEAGGITYIDQWNLELDLLAQTHLDSAWLKIDRANMSVQDLVLQVAGRIDDYTSENIGIDLAFNAPDASVASFWSLLPPAIVKDMNGLQSEGIFSVDGTLAGEIAEGTLPDLNADLQVRNGSVKYPDLPTSITGLTLDATLTNDELTVREFSADADGARLRSQATITNFASPVLDADIDLNVNLEELANYYPLEDSTQLSGALSLDTQVKGPVDKIDDLNIAGVIELESVDYSSSQLEQPVSDLGGRIYLESDRIRLNDVSMVTGQSDVKFEGVITGYEAFLADSLSPLPDPVIKGQIVSSYLNLTEQMSSDTTSTFVGPLELPPIQLDIELSVDELEFNGVAFKDASGYLSLTEGIMGFDDISATLFGGLLNATGSFDLSDPLAPAFNGGVGLSQIPATEFFSALPDMDAIVQLGNYLKGFFNSEATFGLSLDKDLNPQYETAIASGVFGSQQGAFGTVPLQAAIAQYTGVNGLESLDVKDWSHAFSVSGEKLHVQDLSFDAGEYAFSLNGTQSFDGGMDYQLRVELPESASSALAAAPVQGALSSLSSTISTALQNPETGRITLDLLASGSFNDPSVKLDSEQMAARLTASITQGLRTEAESRADSLQQLARERAEAELEEQRQRLEERAEEGVEQLVGDLVDSSLVTTPLDSLKEKGADALQDRLKGLLNRKKRNN